MKREQLPALTGLRFVAALWVVLHHYGQYYLPPGPLREVCRMGAVGVTLFFVLSGFILASSQLDRRQRVPSIRAFYWRRWTRIYPLYAFALAGSLPLLLLGGTHPAAPLVLACVTLLQAWIPAYQIVWDSPTWSLSAEAWFYALFPLLAPLCARLPRWGLLGGLVACWLLSCLGAAWTWHAGGGHLTLYTPLLRLPEFVFGILLGLLFRRAGPLRGGDSAVVVATALLLLSVLSTTGLDPVQREMGLLLPCFGLLIYALAAGRGRVCRVLSTPGCRRLGEASFALYLVHVPVWGYLTHALHGTDTALYQVPLTLPLYLLCALSVALVCHLGIEQPARRWLVADHRVRHPLSPVPNAPPAL